jgi:hypothetical protein
MAGENLVGLFGNLRRLIPRNASFLIMRSESTTISTLQGCLIPCGKPEAFRNWEARLLLVEQDLLFREKNTRTTNSIILQSHERIVSLFKREGLYTSMNWDAGSFE